MKSFKTTYHFLTLALLLSLVVVSNALGQYAFEIPKSENDRILSFNGIQVDVSGKLALCSHSEKGSIILNVTGGVPPYTFLWNTKETTQNRGNLFAGTYTVEITDSQGLKHIENIVVQPPFPFILNPVEKTDASCGSSADGSAKISVKIGRGEPYKVTWSHGLQDSWEANDLKPGTYIVTVADRYNCDVSMSFQINSKEAGMQVTESVVDASCAGKNDGSITLNVSGGQAPYTYTWSNGVKSKDLSNVSAGVYEVLIQDQGGCTMQASYKVEEPKSMEVEAEVINPSCSSDSNGTIDLNVIGGTAPYTITWNNGASGAELKNLPAGIYSARIVDASGCFIDQQVELKAESALSLDLIEITNQSCTGEADGAIKIAHKGGKGQVTVTWADGVSGELNRTGLAAGTYEVSITDESGCAISGNYSVSQSEAVTARIESALDVNCEQGSVTGHAWVSITGGKEPFTISWSSGEKNTREINYFQAGVVEVTVTDATGCSSNVSAVLDFPSQINQSGRLDFQYRKLQITTEPEVFIDEEILFESQISPEIIAWEWSFGDGVSSTEKDPIHVYQDPGTYEVKLTGYDIFGCSTNEVSSVQVITAEAQVVIPNAFTPNGDGLNDTFIPKIKNINSFTLEIFNTWGEKMFFTNSPESKGWDGTYKGQLLPAGNYLYRITYTDQDSNQKEKTGGVTLIR
ncbi:gliding motility-associated C-terminal domain-containing protein [uncultured Algoriphagus sp.]|uniref:T9SS type B sorting domain-containing protein n=1 Tax=uncultured Algoriphagus sp. TaxID=417365 RepID=UPI002584C113|nr:gliding motility-associated C-terminal domain-containing protein [uncultured Algoriphagus sp.]